MTQNIAQPIQSIEIPPITLEGDTNSTQGVDLGVPSPQTPAQPVPCSYNVCSKCEVTWPLKVALVSCPGCKQPTMLIKMENCPRCNEPAKAFKIRMDHTTEKMALGALCIHGKTMSDSVYIEIEKTPLEDDDFRIKDTLKLKRIKDAGQVNRPNS